MGTSKRFEVALSFPGERRDYVAAVAGHLAERLGRERVLYDRWHEAEFARPDLDTYLQTLYHDQAALIAVFLCADYERKDWCGGVEWRAVKDLIKRREGAAIMPLRFDNTEIPGLFSTDGYIWLGDGRDPAEVAALILTRWQLNGGTLPAEQAPAPEPRPGPRVDITRLPAGAEHFLGRVPELAALDAAWAPGSGIAVVVVVAPAAPARPRSASAGSTPSEPPAGAARAKSSAGPSTAKAPATIARPRRTCSSPLPSRASASTSTPPPTRPIRARRSQKGSAPVARC